MVLFPKNSGRKGSTPDSEVRGGGIKFSGKRREWGVKFKKGKGRNGSLPVRIVPFSNPESD